MLNKVSSYLLRRADSIRTTKMFVLPGMTLVLATLLSLSQITPSEAHDCTVKVFVQELLLAVATDADNTDFYRFDTVVVVNAISQKGFFATGALDQGVPTPVAPPEEIYNAVFVDGKGKPLVISANLSGVEIDNPGANEDPAVGANSLPLGECMTNVQNLTVHVQATPVPPEGDGQDKVPPVVGRLEVKLRIEIDP